MKTRLLIQTAGLLIFAWVFFPVANFNHGVAQEQRRPSAEKAVPQIRRSIEEYRQAIKDTYRVDIVHFKDRLKGGRADGKPITNYDLKELLMGIKFEREHTDDVLLALEMAMDHLETVPDYYTRHQRLEQEIISDMLLRQ